jgi:hypothetical protein
MKPRISLILCAVLLSALALPAPGSFEVTGQTLPDLHQLRWRVAEPVKFENLTVYPVFSSATVPISRFITLDEGLKSGKVIVSEIGARGRARRLRPGQEPSDNSEVNKLMVTNRSGKPLLLIAGELVIGGKQDRIVGHDCVIEASARPVPVDVFCVEHGRWQEESFGASRADTIIASRADTITTNSVARRGRRPAAGVAGGVGAGSGGGYGPGDSSSVSGPTLLSRAPALLSPNPQPPPPPPMGFASASTYNGANGMASPKIREKAQGDKDQNAVWTKVAEVEMANGTKSETGTLGKVFENKAVLANLDGYERTIKSAFPRNAIGAVAAINGKIVSADLFANPSLFEAYWPKLLRSLALQAAGSEVKSAENPTSSDAREFLARSGKQGQGARKPMYRLVEHKSDETASFELRSSRQRNDSLIHFNKVVRE